MDARYNRNAAGAREDNPGGTTVPLPRGRLGETDLPFLRSPEIRDFAAYYLSIRGERRMPGRRDIDPTAIPRLLANLWLWAFDPASGRFTLRLAGETVARRFPSARRGTALEAFIPPAVLDMIRARYTRVVVTPAGVHAIGDTIVEGGSAVFSERLLLPLGDDGNAADGLIGITAFGETAFRDLGFVRESGTVETWLDPGPPAGPGPSATIPG